jgi:hypothetical protein
MRLPCWCDMPVLNVCGRVRVAPRAGFITVRFVLKEAAPSALDPACGALGGRLFVRRGLAGFVLVSKATRHLHLATFAPDIITNTHQRPQHSLQATLQQTTSSLQQYLFTYRQNWMQRP